MQLDTAFQMSASNIRFGVGVTSEVGLDLRDMGLRRTLLVIDPALESLPTGETVMASLRTAGTDFEVFDRISIEPTEGSFQEAAEVAKAANVKMLLLFHMHPAIEDLESFETEAQGVFEKSHVAKEKETYII